MLWVVLMIATNLLCLVWLNFGYLHRSAPRLQKSANFIVVIIFILLSCHANYLYRGKLFTQVFTLGNATILQLCMVSLNFANNHNDALFCSKGCWESCYQIYSSVWSEQYNAFSQVILCWNYLHVYPVVYKLFLF